MRRPGIASLLCLLFGLTGPAGARTVVDSAFLERIPTGLSHGGAQLETGWRYHPGPHPNGADPVLDDSGWTEVRIGLGESVPNEGLAWLRLDFEVAEDIAGERLVLVVAQVGAMALYLDGTLFARVGIADASAETSVEQARTNNWLQIPITLEKGPHTLAIRRSAWWTHDHPLLMRGLSYPADFLVGLGRYDEIAPIWRRMGRQVTIFQMLWGVPFVLALVHLFIFGHSRSATEHLSYGLFALSIAGMVFFPFQSGWTDSIWLVVLMMSLFKCALICSALFGLRYAHGVFGEHIPPRHRYADVLVAGLCVASPVVPLPVYYALTFAGFVWMAAVVVRALFRGHEGALIVTTGIFLLTVLSGVQILMETSDLVGQDYSFPYIYGVLALTLTMSIHLGRTYARTHDSLTFQISQVEALTRVTVAQERESVEQEARVREQVAQQELLEAEHRLRTQELEDERARQQVLEELEASNLQLRQTQSRLVQTERMAAIGHLVAGIAHEINTPVGAIHGSHDTLVRATRRLEAALEDSPDLKARLAPALRVIREANRVITTGTQRVTEIVRSLRNFARLDEAEMKRANVHEGLDSTLTLVHHYLKNRIRVEKQYGDLPEIVCYPSRLNQVFLNLLTNATQAIEGEGVIRIRTALTDGQVVIEIEDTGEGVDPSALPHIFESGYTTKKAGEGTGLGLAISKQIVDDHGGTIGVESERGRGATFRITLPIHPVRRHDSR